MPQIVASSCDRDRLDSFALLVVDGETLDVVRYSLGCEGASARGLAVTASHLFCAYVHDGESFLSILELGSFRLHERIALSFVRDVHSIVVQGNDLFAASTGDDRIVRMDLDGGGFETIWRASDSGTDTHHLNGLAIVRGRLVCSGFGPKMGPAWADAMDGYLYDVTNAAYVKRGIYQPHSVCGGDDGLYFCESALGKVRSELVEVCYLRGYARGLAIDGDLMYAASSVARRRSRSDFVIANPSDAGSTFGRCEILFGRRGEPFRRVDLAGIAQEIYDLAILSG